MLAKGLTMNKTTKINILTYASEPDKNYDAGDKEV